jgi:DtxR family transcriptional regulator, Mn-dependent transcriptional regulator
MPPSHSASFQDYLKVIYDLTASGKRASTNALARRLNVAPASVTGMIKRMASSDPPLLKYEKHRGVVLTFEGQSVALKIIRNHRLLELFLQQTLGYSWDEVHAEADRLEHVISEEMEDRIARALGEPSHDPHGEPIPTRDLRLPPSSDLTLNLARPGEQVRVERVEATDLELLRYLSKIGLVPDVEIHVKEHSVFDDNLRLQIEDQDETVVLGPMVTKKVYITMLP